MSGPEVYYHYPLADKDFAYHDRHRAEFQRLYAKMLAGEPAIGGRVLDIGCGHGKNPSLMMDIDGRRVLDRMGSLDGVDPFPVMVEAPHVANRWVSELQDIPVADETYDMAYSYNVIEHVDDVDSFLKKTVALLKPGAAYLSMAPNAHHPFTWFTRAAERLRLKDLYAKFNSRANHYPAYYRASHDGRVMDSIRRQGLPVSRVDFYFVPNVNWDSYFPKALRLFPHLLDKLVLLKRKKAAFVFIMRIERAAA